MSTISVDDARQKYGAGSGSLVQLVKGTVEGSGCSKVYIYQLQGHSGYSHFKLFFPAETVAVANKFAMQRDVLQYKKIYDNGQVLRDILEVHLPDLPVGFDEGDYSKKRELLRDVDFSKDETFYAIVMRILEDNLRSYSVDDLRGYCIQCEQRLSKQHFDSDRYYLFHNWFDLARLYYKCNYPAWIGDVGEGMDQPCEEAKQCLLAAIKLDPTRRGETLSKYPSLLSRSNAEGRTTTAKESPRSSRTDSHGPVPLSANAPDEGRARRILVAVIVALVLVGVVLLLKTR